MNYGQPVILWTVTANELHSWFECSNSKLEQFKTLTKFHAFKLFVKLSDILKTRQSLWNQMLYSTNALDCLIPYQIKSKMLIQFVSFQNMLKTHITHILFRCTKLG